MKITQACIGPSVTFFKKNFLTRWNLTEYHDINKPCVFLEGGKSSTLIQKHNSYKIIIPVHPFDLPNANIVTNYEKVFIISPPLPRQYTQIYYPVELKTKNIIVELKDYSLFKPNILGDKIYSYTGHEGRDSTSGGWKHPWRIDKLQAIQKKINFEIITTDHARIEDYHDINFLKENFYDKCFLNLNFSIRAPHSPYGPHGMSTVIEMGLMGRKTIMNEDYYKFPSILGHSNDSHIVDLINQESKKIGTVQPSMNAHTVVDDEWLDTDFWEQ